eukprot:CAMPEP_0197610860 /NCGR_PEP_ID=MMETSP1326-20131121/54214_1 /TAXON_ID=1155430 /ORGANISM="Genus nov. species nov., Strain RCC2288" /LENGTH=48 /DNA_ID= /DNA_START= /DNA_END= /DNA_ORIENTATION=
MTMALTCRAVVVPRGAAPRSQPSQPTPRAAAATSAAAARRAASGLSPS